MLSQIRSISFPDLLYRQLHLHIYTNHNLAGISDITVLVHFMGQKFPLLKNFSGPSAHASIIRLM
ncbi:hypothetical protein CANARDRAFT_30346 [[Candida] arabinofermentans NRRL YB-2248]|uniref:Uncharacterized protein n=1 Tax=[Candida] arabinofermentans NRRL YB-2248 TaxID=983967 RepID=A0A1E4SU99_9ASCO|nr:hypothetical protein CANARDRAFT_30346 [[Candida] arabinofermentans NRRL YB-2248]